MKLRPSYIATRPGYMFYCPGCREVHIFDLHWTWDGNKELPSFTPSLKHGPSWRMPPDWDYDTAPRDEYGSLVLGKDGRVLGAIEWTCHLFLTKGVLEYCSDSTHEYAGKKIPLPDMPDWACSDEPLENNA